MQVCELSGVRCVFPDEEQRLQLPEAEAISLQLCGARQRDPVIC